MKYFKYMLLLFVAMSVHSTAFGDEQDDSSFDQNLNERDFHILRDYVYTKRTINLEEKDWNLSISGDVRTEWRHLNEKGRNPLKGGKVLRLRGKGAENADHLPISRNDFDIELNLRFDYVYSHSWGVAALKFDDSAGIDSQDLDCKKDPEGWFGSGRCDNICLRKAYMGYNLLCKNEARIDIELGRRNLYDVFDSYVQFVSRFDGLLIRFSKSIKSISDIYFNIAGFLVDERVNQFAWVCETGFMNLWETNVDLKYSYIDWTRNGKNRCHKSNPDAFKFRISQGTIYYHPEIESCKAMQLYAAVLYNHSARDIKDRKRAFDKIRKDTTEQFEAKNALANANAKQENPNARHIDIDNKALESTIADAQSKVDKHKHNVGKQPWAWYVGVLYGEVIKEGDYALEVQYQWVQAQAVPNEDSSGIGRGNVLDETFTSVRRGNTNFKGWKVEGLYALTDNLTFDAILEHSVALQKKLGGYHHYSKFELEAVYAF